MQGPRRFKFSFHDWPTVFSQVTRIRAALKLSTVYDSLTILEILRTGFKKVEVFEDIIKTLDRDIDAGKPPVFKAITMQLNTKYVSKRDSQSPSKTPSYHAGKPTQDDRSCHKCKKIGHISRNCPTKQQSSTELCRNFQNGRCERGDGCKYKHETKPGTKPPAAKQAAPAWPNKPNSHLTMNQLPVYHAQVTAKPDAPADDELTRPEHREPESELRNRQLATAAALGVAGAAVVAARDSSSTSRPHDERNVYTSPHLSQFYRNLTRSYSSSRLCSSAALARSFHTQWFFGTPQCGPPPCESTPPQSPRPCALPTRRQSTPHASTISAAPTPSTTTQPAAPTHCTTQELLSRLQTISRTCCPARHAQHPVCPSERAVATSPSTPAAGLCPYQASPWTHCVAPPSRSSWTAVPNSTASASQP